MRVTRTVKWEYTREYNSIGESKADEDTFMRDTMCENAELYSNELTDESGCLIDGDENGTN